MPPALKTEGVAEHMSLAVGGLLAALWITVVLTAYLAMGVAREFRARMAMTSVGVAEDGLPIGQQAPRVVGLTGSGSDFDSYGRLGVRWWLVMLSAGCAPCEHFASEFRGASRHVLPVVLCVRSATEARALAIPEQSEEVVFDDDRTIARAFATASTPRAFLIEPDGSIGAKCYPTSLADLINAAGFAVNSAIERIEVRQDVAEPAKI